MFKFYWLTWYIIIGPHFDQICGIESIYILIQFALDQPDIVDIFWGWDDPDFSIFFNWGPYYTVRVAPFSFAFLRRWSCYMVQLSIIKQFDSWAYDEHFVFIFHCLHYLTYIFTHLDLWSHEVHLWLPLVIIHAIST